MDCLANESDVPGFEDESPAPTPVYVFYHASCADGFAAAWVAWRALGDGAEYRPVQYGHAYPPVVTGSRVYVLDFSYPADELIELADRMERVTVLDHHLSAERDLAGLTHPNLEIIFDQTRSGAMIAWDYFREPGALPGDPPLIVRYVQDRDLWAWELPNSRAFSAALRLVPFDFRAWEELSQVLDEDSATGRDYRADFLRRGEAIVEAQDTAVKGLCDKAFTTRIAGHGVPCVNSPLYQSEIGDLLCARHPAAPFAAVWFAPDMTSRVYSLRSRNGFDVSAVARLFGGGGHAPAASFRVNNERMISRAPGPETAGGA